MKPLLFAALATLALPLYAQEMPYAPDIRVYSDCTVRITLDLPTEIEVQTAPPHLYETLGEDYPSWLESVRMARTDETPDTYTLEIRATEAVPDDTESVLLLTLRDADNPERTYQARVPSCQKPLTRSKERVLHDVVSGDTLMGIALQYTGELDVDVNTLMLAIQSFNRGSFLRDNINILRADRDVVIPTQADISRLDLTPEYVRDEVARQHTRWREFKEGRDRRGPTRNRPLVLVPLNINSEVAQGQATATPVSDESDVASVATPEPNTSSPDEEPAPAMSETGSMPDSAVEAQPQNTAVETANSSDADPVAPPLDAQSENPDETSDKDPAASPANDADDGIHAAWFAVLGIALLLVGIYLAVLGLRRYRRTHLIRKSITRDPSNPSQQMASLLDLARAHIEANDPELARPFLEEVLARGDAKERKEAESLRSRIQNND